MEGRGKGSRRLLGRRPPPTTRTDAPSDAPATNLTPTPAATFVELFAGIGGFRVGLEALGLRCAWACEIEGQARACYRANFPDTPAAVLHGDIAVALAEHPPPRDHDLLVGGFPCQPFTRLGSQEGFEHKRGKLFEHILDILREATPPMFLLENVPGLLMSPGGAGTLEAILSDLSNCGYYVSWKILDSSALLPQQRRRIYIVGFAHASGVEAEEFAFPVLPRLRRGVGDILCTDIHGEPYGNADAALEAATAATVRACTLSKAQWDSRLSLGAPANMFYIKPDLPAPTLTKSYRKAPGKKSGRRFAQMAIQKMAKRRRLGEETRRITDRAAAETIADSRLSVERKLSKPSRQSLIGWCNLIPRDCEAVMNDGTTSGGSGDGRPRFFTPRECARLQGFPESFKIVPSEHTHPNGPHAALFGNAVSPPVIAVVAGAMLDCLATAKARRSGGTSGGGASSAPAAVPIGKKGSGITRGINVALNMLLEAVPLRSAPVLRERIQSALNSPDRDGDSVRIRSANDDAVGSTGDRPVCFRFRDQGACSWGDRCRFSHVAYADE